MRVNINLQEELVKKIDEKASAMYISRSAYISTALSQKLQMDEIMEYMPDMMRQLGTMDKQPSQLAIDENKK